MRENVSWKCSESWCAIERKAAAVHVGGLTFDGLPGWLVWRVHHLARLVGAKDRLSVLLDWAFAWFHQYETTRLELEREPEITEEAIFQRVGRER